jgi:hypothetical protein
MGLRNLVDRDLNTNSAQRQVVNFWFTPLAQYACASRVLDHRRRRQD